MTPTNTQRTLVMVTPYFLPHGGGLERYAFEIASRLQKNYGWRIVVITSGEKGNGDIIDTYQGLTVHRLGYQFKLSNTPFSLQWGAKIRKIVAQENPDLINVHMPVPGIGDIAVRVAGDHPIVLTYHAGTMRKGRFLLDVAIWFYEHLVLPGTAARAVKIICSSGFVKRSVFADLGEKAIIVTPGVDISIFKPDSSVAKSPHEIVFISNFASMHKLKGFFVLVDAVKSLTPMFPDISIKVIGEKGTSNEPFVHFVGPKTAAEVVKEMQSSSLLVLCSLAPAESFGMVLIEAMACGLSVIGSTAGGIPEVINDGEDGILIPSGDSNMLAVAIERILSDATLARKMQEAGYKKVTEDYIWEKKVAQTSDIFSQILNKRGYSL